MPNTTYALLGCAVLGVALLGCGSDGKVKQAPQGKSGALSSPPSAPWRRIELPQAEARAGTAVAILIDTSGSMGQKVRDRDGKDRAKHEIAREALAGIIRYTGDWQRKHPERLVCLGVYHFSSIVAPALPMDVFDQAKAEGALARLPQPNSGTAIGRALEQGFQALYGSGCLRKYVICITDGENTSGPPPNVIAGQLFFQTQGDVEIHFVAFDVAASRFTFLSDVNGYVVEAADAKQLDAELAKIYEKRILAEAEEPETK